MANYFLNFDKLLGTQLIVILYYLGLAGIALGAIASLFGALAMMGASFIGGLGMIVMTLIGAVIGVLVWRFICELYLILFRISDDVREIKNAKVGGAPLA
ncbi:DUF4282 domain-containing protein [Hyphomonas sp.]|uniref:DUF4282 domain-containing protein n=1 Tax=Hyphomonas sp. TaxID=87 RepID=UPI003919BD15